MRVTASALRADVYNLLDRALESGEPLEVERRGQVLTIVPPRARHWLDRLPRRDVVVGPDLDTGDADLSAGLAGWAWDPDDAR